MLVYQRDPEGMWINVGDALGWEVTPRFQASLVAQGTYPMNIGMRSTQQSTKMLILCSYHIHQIIHIEVNGV